MPFVLLTISMKDRNVNKIKDHNFNLHYTSYTQ